MIYFDNAATTYPKPPNVVKSVVEAIVDYGGNPGRGGHNISLKASQKIYDTRKKISEMFNCEVQNVVFTSNCTQSLNY
ncbi:MAG: aminotransferase class V-fold PLP-dependent enzyme, partial [Oscillospiraceae bacterium]